MNNDFDILKQNFIDRPFKKGTTPILDYCETTYLPSGKFRGVKFSHNRAPYLKEPISFLGPDSDKQEVRCMFPAQTGKSTIAEMVIEYYIVEYPTEILYVSSNETAAMKFMQRRIEPRCAYKGVEFRSDVDSKSARRTGDTQYSKSFNGGNLDIASSLSPAQLASESKRLVIGDEIDRWKLSISSEGNPLDILYARTQAWGDEKRILLISTPTTEDVSLMNKLYLDGDRRLYYVACPFCNHFQVLDFYEGDSHGLKWEIKDEKIKKSSVVYVCESCKKPIKETLKNKMLNSGEWRKTGESISENIVSYHINGLYSPFISWYEMAVDYEKSKNNIIKMQAFENLKMGRPFKRKGTRPKVEFVIENNRHASRRSCDVPDGVLYITAGVDVQRGSKTDPNNPPRLEMEVLGIGIGHRTWSIEYRVFEGSIDNPFQGAWEDLFNYMVERDNKYTRADGFQFPVSLMFIDAGDGEYMDIVYMYSQRWTNAFPSKGFKALTRRKKEKPDEITESSFIRYRAARMDGDITLYEISTAYYKTQIYANLKVKRVEGEIQSPGFCDFPADYGENYFEMLTAEELTENGYDNKGRRNESLDCRVYALCAADVYLASVVKEWQNWAINERKMSRAAAEAYYTKTWVLQDMVEKTQKKFKKNV